MDPQGNTTIYDYYTKDDLNPGNRGQAKWVRNARYDITRNE